MARSRIICHNRIRTTSRWPAVAAGLAYRSLNLATHAANIDHFFVAQYIVIRVDNRIRELQEALAATLGFLPEIDIATSLVIAVVVAGVVLLARRPDVALRTRKSRGSRQRRKAMNTSPSSTTSG